MDRWIHRAITGSMDRSSMGKSDRMFAESNDTNSHSFVRIAQLLPCKSFFYDEQPVGARSRLHRGRMLAKVPMPNKTFRDEVALMIFVAKFRNFRRKIESEQHSVVDLPSRWRGGQLPRKDSTSSCCSEHLPQKCAVLFAQSPDAAILHASNAPPRREILAFKHLVKDQ